MTNLLTETREVITQIGHKVSDIIYIGSRDGYACTWEEFETLADVEYDSGYGAAEVATDLEIHFKDGVSMFRGEYDGSEWWTFSLPFRPPKETKRIGALTGCLWPSLQSLSQEETSA